MENKRYIGFKTFAEMQQFIEEEQLRAEGYGWNEDDQHYFEVKSEEKHEKTTGGSCDQVRKYLESCKFWTSLKNKKCSGEYLDEHGNCLNQTLVCAARVERRTRLEQA